MKVPAWWQQRDIREKQVLIAGTLIAVAVIVFLLLESAVQERRRLASELPQLREDLQWMQTHIGEVREMREALGMGAASVQGFSAAMVETLLRNAGLEDEVTELRPLPEGGIRLVFIQVNYAELMDFIYRLGREVGARIAEARFGEVAGRPGMVQASLSLVPGP